MIQMDSLAFGQKYILKLPFQDWQNLIIIVNYKCIIGAVNTFLAWTSMN